MGGFVKGCVSGCVIGCVIGCVGVLSTSPWLCLDRVGRWSGWVGGCVGVIGCVRWLCYWVCRSLVNEPIALPR